MAAEALERQSKQRGFFVVWWLISVCVYLCTSANDSLVFDSPALLLLLPWRAQGAAGSRQPGPPCQGFCFKPTGEGVGPMLGQNQPLHRLPSRFAPCNRCNSSFQPCSQLQSPVPGCFVLSLGAFARGNVTLPVAARDAALGRFRR